MIIRKMTIASFSIIGVCTILYSLLWLASAKTHDVAFGISFNQNHASSLGLDWKETYVAMLDELKPKYVRIAAMWSEIEPEDDRFVWDGVDFMMDEAGKRGTEILLVVGQKAPRWPECHVPAWVNNLIAQEDVLIALFDYVEQVVERYKNHPALELWQIENEPFIRFRFGECANYDEGATYKEIARVRSLDSDHKIVVTDSGELSTWRKASKSGEILGATMYRTVRNKKGQAVRHWWLPPALYTWKARLWGVPRERFFISELQAEPWFTESNPMNTPIDVQEQTMNPDQLQANIAYAKKIGVSRAYFWGVEWWYWMKTRNDDGRYWEIASDALQGTSR